MKRLRLKYRRSLIVRSQLEAFEIGKSEHAVFVGTNGSGKSVLATSILQCYPYVFAIDPKDELKLKDKRVIRNPHDLSKLSHRIVTPIVYAPDPEYQNSETYDSVYEWVYRRENCTIYTDEVFAVMSAADRAPTWMKAILTRGRSLQIRCINSTQRPVSVPLSILSEATHYFMFQLNMPDDVKRMAGLMGKEVLEPLTIPFSFWYKNIKSKEKARVYKLEINGGSE